jgi:L-ribulokinase
MQILADVLGMNIYVAEVEQACAFGAAMFAATAAGVYHKVQDAQIHMGQGVAKAYIPNQENHTVYKQLYQEYIRIGQQT